MDEKGRASKGNTELWTPPNRSTRPNSSGRYKSTQPACGWRIQLVGKGLKTTKSWIQDFLWGSVSGFWLPQDAERVGESDWHPLSCQIIDSCYFVLHLDTLQCETTQNGPGDSFGKIYECPAG